MNAETSIRPFDGSLSDALGILAVEKASFDESPYSGKELRSMLSDGPQRAWVAAGQGKVLGFVVAFPIWGFRGPSWEIDTLAILPAWRGRRLATNLIQAAVAHGASLAGWSRAVVATDNAASSRAFVRVGYRAGTESNTLLVRQGKELAAGYWLEPELPIREIGSLADAQGWLLGDLVASEEASCTWPQSYRASLQGRVHDESPGSGRQPGFTLLAVEREGQIVGHVELVQVQTILYRGMWIESLVARDRIARETLIHSVLSRARATGLDEIGALVPNNNPRLYQALMLNGFHSLGEYYWHTAEISLSESGPLVHPPQTEGLDS